MPNQKNRYFVLLLFLSSSMYGCPLEVITPLPDDNDDTCSMCQATLPVHCWDLDESLACDVSTEDFNGDGKCTVLDCRYGPESSGTQSEMDIVQVDDARIVYSPPGIDCGPGQWCAQSPGWGINRFADDGRSTECAGERDCSDNQVVLILDDNQHRTVLLSHFDQATDGLITVELSYDGGANYQFHKVISGRRSASAANTSNIHAVASNLPLGLDIRVRLIASKGRMHFEGFALSQTVLPESNDRPFRALASVSGQGPDDNTCNVNGPCGPLPLATRTLNFVKAHDDTRIRIQYTDVMRSYVPSARSSCQWQVYVDGNPCPSGDIFANVFNNNGSYSNPHHTRTVAGYCTNVPAGEHTVQVYVRDTPYYSVAGCATGWPGSHWSLEAEEVQ